MPAPCALSNFEIGGFFLFGGVIMFFDRAMYAPNFLQSRAHMLKLPRLAMGNVRLSHYSFSMIIHLTTATV